LRRLGDLDLLRHAVPTVTTLRIPREDIGRRSASCWSTACAARLGPVGIDVGFDRQREST
jgi:LacI family gluconate utilization system Gnt-I transcriptional repressor